MNKNLITGNPSTIKSTRNQREVVMRDRNRKSNRDKMLSTVVTLSLVGALTVGIASVVIGTNNKLSNMAKNQENIQESLKFYDIATEELKKEKPIIDVTVKATEEKKEMPEERKVSSDSDTAVAAKYSFSENDNLIWPVEGKIIMNYNMDSTVFYKTLGVYKVNPAINIAAQTGTPVLAAASGVVTKISKNEETGNTVTVDIGNGYETTYGLLSDVAVKEGSLLMAKDKIGNVSEPTNYYTEEGSNLYFKMTKKGEPVDPNKYLIEQ